MNSERVKRAIREAFTELQGLDPSALQREILEHVGGPIAELLIGSGMFEGRVEGARVLDPFEDEVPTAVFWTTDAIKSSLILSAWEPDTSSGTPYLAPIMPTGLNLKWSVSEVRVASLTASAWEPNWNGGSAYLASVGHQMLDWQKIVVANNAGLVNSLDWRIPNPREESAEDEPLEWVA